MTLVIAIAIAHVQLWPAALTISISTVFQLMIQDPSHSVHFSHFRLTLHSCSNFHESHTSGSMCCDWCALHGMGDNLLNGHVPDPCGIGSRHTGLKQWKVKVQRYSKGCSQQPHWLRNTTERQSVFSSIAEYDLGGGVKGQQMKRSTANGHTASQSLTHGLYCDESLWKWLPLTNTIVVFNS